MRAFRSVPRLIPAGLVLLGLAVAIGVASFRAGFNARCKAGNMTGALSREQIEQVREDGSTWMSHALTCTVGDYEVVIPDGAEGENGYILWKRRPLLFRTARETDLFDDYGGHILFSLLDANSKSLRTITYSGFDEAKRAVIENFDVGADGTLDYRITEVDGHTVKEEYRVGEHWLEAVDQDGRTGVVLKGRFMPVVDAIKLSEKSKSEDNSTVRRPDPALSPGPALPARPADPADPVSREAVSP
jgi:hypothetical protein